MALLFNLPLTLVSTSQRSFSPAKISNSSSLILCTPSLFLHPPAVFFSVFSTKPIFSYPPQKYIYPDPIPAFAKSIFSDFLHEEYGGPGTLLVEPFTDMLVALKEKKLPGATLASRESLLWAQNYVDQDWEVWNSNLPN